jgi:hypothetical protein
VAEAADLIRVTSQEWCDRFAAFLLEARALQSPYEPEFIPNTNIRKVDLPPFDAPDVAAKKFVDRNQPVPARIVKLLLKERKQKKGGRHTNLKQWADDRANAYSCFFSMERLFSTEKISQAAAAKRIGKLRGRSPEAVLRAWKKIKAEP